MEILGISIAGLLALILAIVGVLMVTNMKFFGLGPMVRGVFGKRIALFVGVALLIVSVGGAVAYASSALGGLGINTASLTGEDVEAETYPGISGMSCVIDTPTWGGTGLTTEYGVTFTDDPDDLSHYNAQVIFTNGTLIINGTITCERTGDVDKAGQAKCWAIGDTFRSETSTSDQNTYRIVADSAAASKVPGVTYQQTIYLNDGAVATAAHDKEMTQLVFAGGASAEAQEDLGYRATLPGTTIFGYLDNQTSKDIKFYCDWGAGQVQIARLTVTKVSA